MSSKEDYKDDGKYDEKEEKYEKDSYDYVPDLPKIEILSIEIEPSTPAPVAAPIDLKIKFELSRDCVAAYWVIQLLVDSTNSRIIKVLGETSVEDYPDGESDMHIFIENIDVSGIPISTLTNSGLLMAKLIVDGEEVASVNMVCPLFLYIQFSSYTVIHQFILLGRWLMFSNEMEMFYAKYLAR